MSEVAILEKKNAEMEEELRECRLKVSKLSQQIKVIQAQLVKSESMSSLGGLVAGVAHEINTPIGIGVTSMTFLEEKIQKIDKLYRSGQFKKSDLESFLKSGSEAVNSTLYNLRRAADLISSFKQVAVDQTSDSMREFNVKDYVEEILSSLKPKYKRTGHSVSVRGSDDVLVMNSPGALVQIITNLVMNSLIHGFEGIENGQIILTIDNYSDGAEIIYSDNGRGMSEEISSRMFEPFFTTKEGSGGSGLGMHIVKSLISAKMNGSIEFESIPHEGVSFNIKIPNFGGEHASE